MPISEFVAITPPLLAKAGGNCKRSDLLLTVIAAPFDISIRPAVGFDRILA
jgi:hypothetical protein